MSGIELLFMMVILPMSLMNPFLIYDHKKTFLVGLFASIHLMLLKTIFLVFGKHQEFGISIVSQSQG